jgi:uncharacterized protein YndB with AHSA1/START domain
MNNPDPMLESFLSLRRTFAAPRDTVFRAWTDARALESWFKPQGRQTRVIELDARAGGGYHFEMHTPQGDTVSIRGRYLEVARPEKLVFTWVSEMTEECETQVTVEFVERGKATEIVLTHERFTNERMVAGHNAGWNWMMDQLTTVL